MDIVYSFTHNDETLNIEIGKTHPKVDGWLRTDGAERWMVFTAENPKGEEFPKFINKQRTQTLRGQLLATDLPWVEGTGSAEGYPSEVVFLIWGLSLEQCAELSIEYQQTAVVTGVLGGYAEVIALYDGGEP